jgi:hypothetical protein
METTKKAKKSWRVTQAMFKVLTQPELRAICHLGLGMSRDISYDTNMQDLVRFITTAENKKKFAEEVDVVECNPKHAVMPEGTFRPGVVTYLETLQKFMRKEGEPVAPTFDNDAALKEVAGTTEAAEELKKAPVKQATGTIIKKRKTVVYASNTIVPRKKKKAPQQKPNGVTNGSHVPAVKQDEPELSAKEALLEEELTGEFKRKLDKPDKPVSISDISDESIRSLRSKFFDQLPAPADSLQQINGDSVEAGELLNTISTTADLTAKAAKQIEGVTESLSHIGTIGGAVAHLKDDLEKRYSQTKEWRTSIEDRLSSIELLLSSVIDKLTKDHTNPRGRQSTHEEEDPNMPFWD